MYFDKVYKSLVIMYSMSFKVVAGAGIGTETSFDGEDMNKISNLLNGVNTGLTVEFGDTIIFKSGYFKLRNSVNSNLITIQPSTTLAQNGTLNIPNLSNDTIVCLATVQDLINKTLTAPKIVDGGYISDATSNELLQFDSVSNAVNHILISNAATNQDPLIEPYGDNTNINLKLKTKGTGKVIITGNDVTKELDFDTSLQNASTTCTLSTGSTTGTRTVTLPSTTSTLAISSASNTFTGQQTFSSTIQPNTIALTGGQKIRSNDSTEIGIYVRNESTSVGTSGTLQVPELTQSAAPTTGELNTAFGLVQGSIGLWHNTTTPTSNRIYLRTSAGTWHYLTLIPSSI